ncbi:hypothetical protein PoB_002851500 [Plakobranchus ocellatus]|uniref:Uncharacterized protein n=1 Tax=Plakobranchus ocellatus TaxID=259542 RepID=A0AAV4A588_9GAST|nr:hypothetical protein PoB_002851500 [Plakobranchus ocellatus]
MLKTPNHGRNAGRQEKQRKAKVHTAGRTHLMDAGKESHGQNYSYKKAKSVKGNNCQCYEASHLRKSPGYCKGLRATTRKTFVVRTSYARPTTVAVFIITIQDLMTYKDLAAVTDTEGNTIGLPT